MARPIPKRAAAPLSANRRVADDDDVTRGREIFGVIALGASLFVLMAMVSLQAGALVMGPFGRSIAAMFYGVAGIGGYALVTVAIVAAVRTLIDQAAGDAVGDRRRRRPGRGVARVLAHLVAASYRVGGHGPGGAIGENLAEILRALITTAGTALLATVSLACAVDRRDAAAHARRCWRGSARPARRRPAASPMRRGPRRASSPTSPAPSCPTASAYDDDEERGSPRRRRGRARQPR